MKTFGYDYNYETIVGDACYPAAYGYCHLATSISELKDDFSHYFITDLSFEDALEYYNKTEEEFTRDVIKKYIETRRKIRKDEKNDREQVA
jgi:hypothetical protein